MLPKEFGGNRKVRKWRMTAEAALKNGMVLGLARKATRKTK